jgi:serine phosphatase RsbU (regulator of sigma subunit)
LSIGYKIRPVKKGFKPLTLHIDDEEVEAMARVEHLRWSWEKRLNGWSYGKLKDEGKKIHPGLVKYDELDEAEKEKDRELVRLIPSILRDINFEAYPVSPGSISKLSYAIKPQSSIHKLLCEINELNDEIRGLASSSPGIDEKIRSVNEKINLTIGEVQGSYNYARHIQKAFLPEDLYIRECFPDSFILYEPKDVVSGDFYLFSRDDDHIIFALADCTGHGIPASLISTIGSGILDQAVNIMKLTNPADIMHYLYAGVHRFLHRDLYENGVQDDMDIILCNLDTRTGILTFSGTGNSLLHVTNGRITEIKPGAGKAGSSDKEEDTFVTNGLQLKENDLLYLCSDGYADQFGGDTHKRYTRKRLKDFLLQICVLPMPEQADILYEEIGKWREEKNEDQTDDITIIGIRI